MGEKYVKFMVITNPITFKQVYVFTKKISKDLEVKIFLGRFEFLTTTAAKTARLA